MNQLVYIENNKPVTDSLRVAETFRKNHKDVLRDIRNLGCSTEFNERNFAPISYTDGRNRPQTKYLITHDGFTMLVMGYTGSSAMQFKEMYIAEFNRMAAKLNGNAPSMQALLQATQNLLMGQTLIVERVDEIETKVNSQITLDSGQQRMLQQAINQKVCSIEPNSSERRSLFAEIHKEVKNRWKVPSYKDVLKQDLPAVLTYIKAWVPVRRVEV